MQDKHILLKAVETHKIIAILRGISKDKLIKTAEALYDGGIRLLEITFSADGSVSDDDTAEGIAMLCKHFEGRMYIGAGTVLKTSQVFKTAEAGGRFIISPNTDKAVIEETVRLGLVSMPGALTPTEVVTAHNYGADFVKLFPVSNMGPDYVKAVKAPLSHVKLLAVGGVDENNMKDYLKAGVQGFGLGSNLVDKKLVEKEDYEGLTLLAKKFTEAIV
jgi:2-dehydro-3-deoxyphosphogluconate aldolase/(4S)-4-hydroxy-2-oxoglutarate aldolase